MVHCCKLDCTCSKYRVVHSYQIPDGNFDMIIHGCLRCTNTKLLSINISELFKNTDTSLVAFQIRSLKAAAASHARGLGPLYLTWKLQFVIFPPSPVSRVWSRVESITESWNYCNLQRGYSSLVMRCPAGLPPHPDPGHIEPYLSGGGSRNSPPTGT